LVSLSCNERYESLAPAVAVIASHFIIDARKCMAIGSFAGYRLYGDEICIIHIEMKRKDVDGKTRRRS